MCLRLNQTAPACEPGFGQALSCSANFRAHNLVLTTSMLTLIIVAVPDTFGLRVPLVSYIGWFYVGYEMYDLVLAHTLNKYGLTLYCLGATMSFITVFLAILDTISRPVGAVHRNHVLTMVALLGFVSIASKVVRAHGTVEYIATFAALLLFLPVFSDPRGLNVERIDVGHREDGWVHIRNVALAIVLLEFGDLLLTLHEVHQGTHHLIAVLEAEQLRQDAYNIFVRPRMRSSNGLLLLTLGVIRSVAITLTGHRGAIQLLLALSDTVMVVATLATASVFVAMLSLAW